MKRYLWGIEVRRLPRHPWEAYAVLSTRAVARRAAQNCRYPYRRIVKYVSESTAGSAGTTRESK